MSERTIISVELMAQFARAMRENGVLVMNTPELSLQLDPTFQPKQDEPLGGILELDHSMCGRCQKRPPDSTMLHGLCRQCANAEIQESVRS